MKSLTQNKRNFSSIKRVWMLKTDGEKLLNDNVSNQYILHAPSS